MGAGITHWTARASTLERHPEPRLTLHSIDMPSRIGWGQYSRLKEGEGNCGHLGLMIFPLPSYAGYDGLTVPPTTPQRSIKQVVRQNL